jgi:hypothetical protein
MGDASSVTLRIERATPTGHALPDTALLSQTQPTVPAHAPWDIFD